MTEVFIAAAKRTPIGKLDGALTGLSAAQLGASAIRSIMLEHDIAFDAIDDVLMGQVLTGGAGQNPARQAALFAGLSEDTPAMTINQVCGAGQRSLHLAVQAIKCGDAGVIIAGGQDSMTEAPALVFNARDRQSSDPYQMDSMVKDGLWDVFYDIHMGVTAEKIATVFQITREAQDAFALGSQRKATRAIEGGSFKQEVIPLLVGNPETPTRFEHDEHPRANVSIEKLAAMSPVFSEEGTITAGNSSGLNDGAAALLIVGERQLREMDLEPMARIVSYASAALDPRYMGLGPVLASEIALEKARWNIKDIEVAEINEAFAAQAIAVNRALDIDPDIVNPNGGAIALGHPLAGSGARIVVTLVHEMQRRGAKKGLASLCVGGGQGVALCLEQA